MFGFMNINMRNFAKNNTQILHNAIDKMNRGDLEVSDILDSDDLLTEVKTSISQLGSFFNDSTRIKELLDYVIREPEEDEHKRGHKYPFNACELICSENQSILNKVFFDQKACEEEEEEDDKKHDNKRDDDDFLMELGEIKKDEDIEITNKEIEENDNKFYIEETPLEQFEKKSEEHDEDLVNIIEKTDEEDKQSPFEKGIETEEVVNLVDELEKPTQEVTVTVETKDQKDDINQLKNKVDQIVNEIEENKERYNKDYDEDEEIPEEINPEEEETKEQANEKEQKQEEKDSLNVSSEFKLDTDILDYFFTFIENKQSLNYVLSGYFAKIFSHFLNLRQSLLMRYVFVLKPEVLNHLVVHLDRKSILECIYKILISYSEDIPNSNAIKIKLLKMVLDNFNPNDIDVVTNVSDFLTELFTIRKMYLSFINNNEVFQMIFDFVLQNINNDSFVYLIKILQKANENILKDFGQNLVTPVFTCNETQEMFFNFTYNVNNLITGNAAYNSQADTNEETTVNIQVLHQQFNNIFTTLFKATEAIIDNFISETKIDLEETSTGNYFETTFGQVNKKLGMRRLNEIEYLRSIFEILINAYASSIFLNNLDLNIIVNKIVDSQFFTYARKLLIKYQFNSLYQKEFENLVTLITNKHAPEKLVVNLLHDSELLKMLIAESFKNSFEFSSGRKIQSGFFATLCEISSIINDSESDFVKVEAIKEEKWSRFIYLYIDPIKQRFKEGLIAPNPNMNDFNSLKFQNQGQQGLGESFKPFDDINQNTEEKHEDNDICVKMPMIELLTQLAEDYKNGKRADSIQHEIEHIQQKKEEMEILHDEDEDQFHYINHDLNMHPTLLHYGSEKNHSENHEFFDNNYWASTVVVDELELDQLTKSL